MDTKVFGILSFFAGLILSLATVFVNLGDWTTQVLIILGILVGVFHRHLRENLVRSGIIYLALAAAAGSMRDLIAVGPYIADIVAAWVSFLGPVVLTTFMMWGSPYLFSKRKS